MTFARTAPTPRRALAGLLGSSLLALTGCTVGGGDPVPDGTATAAAGPAATSPAPTPEEQESTVPDPEATATDAPTPSDLDVGAPEGWTVWQVDRIVLAVPPGFEVSTDLQIANAAATFTPPTTADGELLAASAVFVERGAVGPLGIRVDLLQQVRDDQTGTEALDAPAAVDVPGAVAAAQLRYAYDVDVPGTGRTAPSIQVDVVVQVADPGPQYGLQLSGSEEVLDPSDLDAFTASVQVLPEAGEA